MNIESTLRELVAELIRQELPRVLREHLAESPPVPALVDRYLSVKEAAALVSVSCDTIRQWIGQGKLRRCCAGRVLRVSLQELQRCVEPAPEQPLKASAADSATQPPHDSRSADEMDAMIARMMRETAEREAAKQTVREEATRRGEVLDRWEEKRRVNACLRERGQ
jgi:excisionase family DNA binding protein